MAELWRASEHEPLAGAEWSEARAEEAIAAIVADAEAAFDGSRWPFHPADEVDDGPNAVYLGVAGMAWALHELGSTGWGDAVLGALERYRREPDGGDEWAYAPSYLAGECGIALVGYRLTGDVGLADRVHELVLANLEDEWNELLWGAPGSLLAAEAMLAWTGEPRWEDAWDALAGGELTWQAGPLAKGSNLCHGTAGNAYAFLVLHRRTRDELWLDRARAFAMHAIGQVERERASLGRGRYSLFTGDVGVALFLRHLLDGDDRFPTMGPFGAAATSL